MTIHVVQAGDTIESIANKYKVPVNRLIRENGIINPNNLVIGQTIVIAYPSETYEVKEGDTLESIAKEKQITMMQLYRNNPVLFDRDYIIPGETLVISYDTQATITTNAYAYPFIDRRILRNAMPYLTYLSILNYKTMKGGEIESFYDDSELIQLAKEAGVIPVMLLTSLTILGEKNPEIVYDILINTQFQDRHAQNMANIMKEKGYSGINITITYLNSSNQDLYISYLRRITSYLRKEGFIIFITIDPNVVSIENQSIFENVDYTEYSELVDEIYLMKFLWGTKYEPPGPVSSIKTITAYLDYMLESVTPSVVNIGFPLLGYDWRLPYILGYTQANAVTLESAIELAILTESIISFDDKSKTPHFEYSMETDARINRNIVWFVDARALYEIVKLVIEKKLSGTGLWYIMNYYPQLWLIIVSNCKIERLLPEP
ncbi:MAG: LysM peptidoglycan-binding domain-containing protein [Candidatus Galacturonibacter soehngenii]|nr:LysM peptidoglycan-binding domain-containing protein [Candidatus Galacturonibacter soehngenii]